MTTLRPTAAIALPVAALLMMAAPLTWGFAAAAAPSAAAPAPPAEQKKIPPVSGPEQAAQAPQAPKAIPVERPIHVGDAIEMSDLAGEVRRIGIRATTVRTWEGAEVIVPNASLVSEKVTNWTYSDRLRRMDVPVGVAYGSAPEKVLELLLAVAHAHPGVLAQPVPEALFMGFGESALNFELRAWTGRFNQWAAVRSELGVAVYAALRDVGLEIPFPQREVRLRDGNGVAMSK